MLAEPQVDTVVFDVGRVLFEFTFLPFETLMRDHGYTATKEDFYREVKMLDYERGMVTSDQFIEQVNSLVQAPPTRDAFVTAWSDIFTPIVEMLELAATLKSKYRTFLLSNTSEMHWEFLDKHHGINSIAHGVVTSFQAKQIKPHPDIYSFAEKTLELVPARTVFIDDMPENIVAVKKAGWHGIIHVSASQTKKELRDLGIDVGS